MTNIYRACRLSLQPSTAWRRAFIRLLGSVLPKNDPDFFDQQETATHWWLELDEANVAQREIGFSSANIPIRCAPLGRNWGVFVGEELNSMNLAEQMSKDDFEKAWEQAVTALRDVSG